MFPTHLAYKLPVHFYGKVVFENLKGRIILKASRIRTGLVKFGGNHELIFASREPTRIYLSGTLEIEEACTFGKAINLMVWDNASLKIGNNFSIGSFSRIISFRKIEIRDNVLISWECQIFDTDFHFMLNEEDNSIFDNCKDVIIDSDVWIGSRVTILKSTYLPKRTIVASNSVCSKDYGRPDKSIVLAGIPAKIIKSGFRYLNNKNREMELYKFFSNPENPRLRKLQKD